MPFEAYLNNPNVRAFLDVLAYCEGTGRRYDVLFGGGTFIGNQHPHRFVRAGGYNSDAAGRYQFLGSTWEGLRRQYGFPDFSPHNQDLGAIALIAEKDALVPLVNGDLQTVVNRVRGVWPSLPGGSQKTKTWEQVSSYFANDLAAQGAAPIQPTLIGLPIGQPGFGLEGENGEPGLSWHEFFADDFNFEVPQPGNTVGTTVAIIAVAVLGLIVITRL